MSRKCYLIEEDFNSLEDPDSSARNEQGTARQALLLKFFGINAPRGATKGEVADMLARLEPTKAQLIDYHSWKAEGCPNIAQWRRRFGRQNKISWKIKLAAGFFVLIGLAMHFSQGMRKTIASRHPTVSLVSSLIMDEDAATASTPKNELPIVVSPAPAAAPAISAPSSPAAAAMVLPWPAKAQIVKEQVIRSDDGIFRLLVGTVVSVRGQDGNQAEIEFEGRQFSVPVDAVK